MSTTLIEPDTPGPRPLPEVVIPDRRQRLEAAFTALETPPDLARPDPMIPMLPISPTFKAPEGVIPDLAFILGLVYLEAGLPPEAALRSGLADYDCSYSGMEMEAP